MAGRICDHCGCAVPEGQNICEMCGAMMPVRDFGSGAAAIRQGRDGQSRPKSPSGSLLTDNRESDAQVVDEERRVRRSRPGKQEKKKSKPYHVARFNWALFWAVCLCVIFLGIVGGFAFLKLTDPGQLILARMGYEADETAMWELGNEYLDQGYIEKAIAIEEEAWARDPDREDMYARLTQLCEAYEAASRPNDAEQVYMQMVALEPENPEAYSNIVRIMLAQDRKMEAADFLQTAYEATGDTSFYTQREEMLPKTPTTTLSAGTHSLPRDVGLVSEEGYDIYYILGDDGVLPDDGTLYTEPIHLEEGGWILRAVAVSTDLVSDELSSKFIITLPTPAAPKASLAPGKYEQRQRIRLRNMDEDEVTIYYTIDGTSPTSNSPIYTDEGILLPGGRVTVRAVAVNKYGKVSNEMSVELQINIKFQNYYRANDTFTEFELMKTTYEQFTAKFGTPQSETAVSDSAYVRGNCIRLTYSWGEARFYYGESGAVLYYVDSTYQNLHCPRKTTIGMTETQITEKFRDFGQAENQDGSRQLYYDSGEDCYGKVNIIDDTHKSIDYSYLDSENDATIRLSYYLENGKCVRIVHSYQIN